MRGPKHCVISASLKLLEESERDMKLNIIRCRSVGRKRPNWDRTGAFSNATGRNYRFSDELPSPNMPRSGEMSNPCLIDLFRQVLAPRLSTSSMSHYFQGPTTDRG